MLVAAFRMLHGFVRNIRCRCLALHGHCDSRGLDILVLRVLRILVEVLRHSPLHMLVEGWLHTLLVGMLLASRVVARTLRRSGRTQLVVALLGQVVVLAMPLASSGLVGVDLGGR